MLWKRSEIVKRKDKTSLATVMFSNRFVAGHLCQMLQVTFVRCSSLNLYSGKLNVSFEKSWKMDEIRIDPCITIKNIWFYRLPA